MPLTKQHIADALRTVRVGTGDLVTSGAFQWAAVCETYVSIKLHLPEATPGTALRRIAAESKAAVEAAAAPHGTPIDSFIVEFVDEPGTVIHTERFGAFTGGSVQAAPLSSAAPSPQNRGPTVREGSITSPASSSAGHRPIGGLQQPNPQQAARSLANIRHVIAVGAGKGGVGKSTIALNLAVGLARKGHAVGLLDGDIYGPSMPTMLGLGALDANVLAGKLQPFYVHGVKAMTIGKLVDPEKPLIWRGPMAHGAFKQLTEQTEWGQLDHLVIDLPPGTGDVPLTMAQTLQLSGAVIVCTPQKVAQDDAVRAARMFQQLGIEILGVVENMSFFVGDDGKEYDLFGKGGAEVMAQRLGVPFLGRVPITMALRENSDRGDPTANFTTGGPLAESLTTLVNNLGSQLALASLRQCTSRPTLSIS